MDGLHTGSILPTCKRILEIKCDDEKLNKDFFFDVYGGARKKKEKKVDLCLACNSY